MLKSKKPAKPGANQGSAGRFALQYMNITESIHNSIMREKSFTKHLRKGARSREATALPSRPATLGTTRAPERDSQCSPGGEVPAHRSPCNSCKSHCAN